MTSSDRLRQHPATRFASPSLRFDLRTVADELRAEPTPAHHGHRQKTLYKHGDATTALFVFEPGGSLPTHAAPGTVTILAVDGELEITHENKTDTLNPGQLLVFAPGVPHDVRAHRGGVMLLTVALESSA